jgi:hypothetical protein
MTNENAKLPIYKIISRDATNLKLSNVVLHAVAFAVCELQIHDTSRQCHVRSRSTGSQTDAGCS